MDKIQEISMWRKQQQQDLNKGFFATADHYKFILSGIKYVLYFFVYTAVIVKKGNL